MQQFCEKEGIAFENGKIVIPDWVKHVKLDVGLGRFPIYSRSWLTQEPDTLIFGFEPCPSSLKLVHENWIITKEQMGKNFFAIPVALSTKTGILEFYTTLPLCESSSLLKPTEAFLQHHSFTVEKTEVSSFQLSDFFELLPESLPYIEYLKIDAQGIDLDIVRSGENGLREKVVYVTLEADGYQYEGSDSNPSEIDECMKNIGFIKTAHPNVSDPTYYNSKFESIKDSIYICQKS
uniref:Methyltransferase FkbM domain-containing protein n=1 Tax=viral metagenome TaxID=1070528 RepID=A0A6C0B3R0_9ZZZZ